MQTEAQTPVTIAAVEAGTAPSAASIEAARISDRQALAAKLAAKRAENIASGKPANASTKPAPTAKPKAAKTDKPVTVKAAKPTDEARAKAAADKLSQFTAERNAAARAVEAYIGPSKPFKAASGTFAPINRDNAKPGPSGLGTVRQAVLLLAMLQYGRGNIKPSGEFVRGGFRIPAKLINPNAKPGEMLSAQPESGALGNTLGLTTAYVSGPTSGAGQRDAVYRIDFVALDKLLAATLGDKAVKAAATFRRSLAA